MASSARSEAASAWRRPRISCAACTSSAEALHAVRGHAGFEGTGDDGVCAVGAGEGPRAPSLWAAWPARPGCGSRVHVSRATCTRSSDRVAEMSFRRPPPPLPPPPPSFASKVTERRSPSERDACRRPPPPGAASSCEGSGARDTRARRTASLALWAFPRARRARAASAVVSMVASARGEPWWQAWWARPRWRRGVGPRGGVGRLSAGLGARARGDRR
eukprot:2726445-Prymnesium_polylepis.2